MAQSDSLTKHTIWLREGDMAALQQQFPRGGASAVIRRMISTLVDRKLNQIDSKQLDELAQEEKISL